MATRATIAIKVSDNEFKTIYSHWDGYPSHVGAILLAHYNDEAKVKELIALGDISALRMRVKPEENEVHSFDNAIEDVTIAYGRDRGETDIEARTVYSETQIAREEWSYLFKDGKWFIRDDHKTENKFVPFNKV